MAVMLDVTGDLVLTGHDVFGTLTVDRSGALGLEYQELKSIFIRLAKAMNVQHEQVTGLQTEMDQMHGELHALRQQTASLDGRLSENEDMTREVRIQLESVRAVAEAAGNQKQDEVYRVTKEDLSKIENRCDRLAFQLGEQDKHQREGTDRLSAQVSVCEEQLEKHQKAIEEDLETRLNECDDTLLAHKMDLEGLHGNVNEMNKRKANRTEIHDVQKLIDLMREEQKGESATLREAHQNLEKLNGFVDLANENKAQTETLLRIFREEIQGIRDWASRALMELRTNLRAKMDEAAAVAHIDELRREVRKDKTYFAQATSRVEDGIRHKAEAGDLVRLQDVVQEFKQQIHKPKQLLLGTKCLACDRAVTEDMTVDNVLDMAKAKQQEELFDEVQRILSRSSPGAHGQDLLKFVAVHVGSPTRLHTASGGGPYEARDISDHAPGSHHLVPASPRLASTASRPGTRGPRPAVGAVGEQAVSARSPPREVPPVVRITPRRLETSVPRGPHGTRRHVETAVGGLSIRDALGPPPPLRRPQSPASVQLDDDHPSVSMADEELRPPLRALSPA